MIPRRYIYTIILLLFATLSGYTQDFEELFKKAEKYHKSYFFGKAITIYDTLLTKNLDSTFKAQVQKSLILSENGNNMLQFAATVEPIEQKETPFELFFLKYPGFNNKEWVPTPQNLLGEDSTATIFNYMHYPKNAKTLAYSAPNSKGEWNIYTITKLNDSTWSAPAPLNENITTSGNEVFPYLSGDEKRIYFSSNGHYGMGGYDLYYCEWDQELNDWGVPQNLGFPFSSVGNDYLYYNTPDGIFSVFASDRGTADSSTLTLFSVLYDATPLKMAVEQKEAFDISLLKTKKSSKVKNGDNSSAEDDEYAKVSSKIRNLQNMLAKETEQLDEMRLEYANLTDSIAKVKLAQEITDREIANFSIESEINIAMAQLQEIELEFLSKGILIPQQTDFNTHHTVEIQDYLFSYANNSIGNVPVINTLAPEPEVDLNFKILPKAVLASLDEIPNGLIYQVLLCVLSKPANIQALKGMSPVFERKSATGKYTYTAGVFYKYQDVLKALYRIRKNGFPGALINAYVDGEYTLVKKAIVLEKELKNNIIFRVSISGYDVLPAEALTVIKSVTSKDLAKTTVDGTTEYIIGPFDKKEQAEILVKALEVENIKGLKIDTINKR